MRSSATTKATWSKLRISNPRSQRFDRNVALTGFMAVGKSAVGRSLARRLRRRFVDLDKVIEKSEGMKVREIFNGKGEPYFRNAEKEALKNVLSQDGQVVATGGGVVMDEENLRLLHERTFLICLQASPDVLLRRAGRGRRRPLLAGNDRITRIEELLKQREENYRRARATVDTTELSVDQVVERIIEILNAQSR